MSGWSRRWWLATQSGEGAEVKAVPVVAGHDRMRRKWAG